MNACRTSPVLLTAVAKEIRTANGSIWHIDFRDFGTLFRATVSNRNVRVLVPALTKNSPEPPEEKGSKLHVVTDLPRLQNWLGSLL